MAYRFVDPFGALREFQRALESSRESNWFGPATSGTGSFPAVNFYSKGDDCVLTAEIPGVNKSNIAIDVKGNQIRIRGTKSITQDDNVSAHRRERLSGRFDRTLNIPIKIDADRVAARYEDGVLFVHLPRAESDKPRSVSIS